MILESELLIIQYHCLTAILIFIISLSNFHQQNIFSLIGVLSLSNIPVAPSKRENPSSIIDAASARYEGFRFCIDLRDKLSKVGTMGDLRVEPRNPPLHQETEQQVPMETEQVIPEVDLRSKITGKPAPPKLLTVEP